jgi:hypothetical protein
MVMNLWGELVYDDEPGGGDECNLLARRFAVSRTAALELVHYSHGTTAYC